MALDKSTLEGLIVSKLSAAGFKVDGDHSKNRVMAKAVAEAVVEHIQANAKANVSSGSSAGQWPIE
jgi:hypothetical protein